MTRYFRASTAALVLMASSNSFAADPAPNDPASVTIPATDSGIDLVIELGIGAAMKPEYEGSDEISVLPSPIIDFGYLNIPGLFDLGNLEPEEPRFSFSPSFNLTGERKASDFDDLDGLDDVDATYEVGIGIGYEWTNAEIFGEGRYAFGGAEGFVGEFGAKAIVRPREGLELKAGPFATLASTDYTDTYFGVTPRRRRTPAFASMPMMRMAASRASA